MDRATDERVAEVTGLDVKWMRSIFLHASGVMTIKPEARQDVLDVIAVQVHRADTATEQRDRAVRGLIVEYQGNMTKHEMRNVTAEEAETAMIMAAAYVGMPLAEVRRIAEGGEA